MVCPSCGEPVTSDAFRCAHCGARLLVAAHHAPPAPKPKPTAAPQLRPKRPAPRHHPSAPPPSLPPAPMNPGKARSLFPWLLIPKSQRTPKKQSTQVLTRLAFAGVALVAIAVSNAWKNNEFVGTTSGNAAQSSGFETSPIPNTSTAHAYSAPDGSFSVTFPAIAVESPVANALWGNQTHRTYEVTSTTGDTTSRIRYADFTTGELPTDSDALGDWLCRSIGANPDDKETEVVGG